MTGQETFLLTLPSLWMCSVNFTCLRHNLTCLENLITTVLEAGFLEKTCTLRLNMLADNYSCWGSLDFDFNCWFSG